MAELPVEANTSPAVGVALDGGDGSAPGGQWLRGFAGLPIIRQIGLMLALAASVAVGFSVVLWMKDPGYKPLTEITNTQQASEVAQALQSSGIPYRIDDATGMLLVPGERLHEARMKAAGLGATGDSQVGFERLDGDQGFGVSQFMESAMYSRSLEGELARSISTIQGVRQARVHLAIPKSTAFLRDARQPTASVTVTLSSGNSLGEGQVRAIMNLVAGAVPELLPTHVAVVDQTGRLLSGQDDDPSFAETERQFRYVKQLETKLKDKIHNILLPTVGASRFMAEVSADVDFTWVEQTEELFNPDLPSLRSEQTLEESRVGEGIDGGVPGALSNQPPATATAPQTAPAAVAAASDALANASRRNRSEKTRNFELDRTLSHTRHQVGRVTRLTVSVLVDDLPVSDGGAEVTEYTPWKEVEIERLTMLVKNAIGYSAARGDTVTVVNSPFLEERVEPEVVAPFWTESWFIDLVKHLMGGLLLLLLLLGLLRPLFRSLARAGNTRADAQAFARLAAMRGSDGGFNDELEGRGGRGLLTSGRGSQLDTVRGLVADNPARVAQVVKHWVAKDD